MITEKGKVVAIESNGIWVETANQSACSRCSARKGCGQSLLAQIDGHRSYIKAGLNGYSCGDFREGDFITIGVHETAVVRGSLMVYCIPLLGLMVGAAVGDALGLREPGVVIFAVIGLVVLALGVRWFSRNHSHDQRFQPVIMDASTENALERSLSVNVVAPQPPQPRDSVTG